jgi:hypothetical protein
VNGVSLAAYREFGAGEPLLLITGFGEVMEGWNETFVGITAVAVDLRPLPNLQMMDGAHSSHGVVVFPSFPGKIGTVQIIRITPAPVFFIW